MELAQEDIFAVYFNRISDVHNAEIITNDNNVTIVQMSEAAPEEAYEAMDMRPRSIYKTRRRGCITF